MMVRVIARRLALALPLLLPASFLAYQAHADAAAAKACAAKLPKDAKAIFNATLPQLGPGVNIRDTVTTNTRSLAMAGTISRGTARDSATTAGQCLQLAGS